MLYDEVYFNLSTNGRGTENAALLETLFFPSQQQQYQLPAADRSNHVSANIFEGPDHESPPDHANRVKLQPYHTSRKGNRKGIVVVKRQN